MATEIVNELDGIDLGDKRLNRRSKLVLEALFADPTQASTLLATVGTRPSQPIVFSITIRSLRNRFSRHIKRRL